MNLVELANGCTGLPIVIPSEFLIPCDCGNLTKKAYLFKKLGAIWIRLVHRFGTFPQFCEFRITSQKGNPTLNEAVKDYFNCIRRPGVSVEQLDMHHARIKMIASDLDGDVDLTRRQNEIDKLGNVFVVTFRELGEAWTYRFPNPYPLHSPIRKARRVKLAR